MTLGKQGATPALILLMLIPLLSGHGEELIGISAKPLQNAVELARPFKITYAVNLPADINIDFSAWKPQVTQWQDFVLWDYEVKKQASAGQTRFEITMTLLAFRLGKIQVPAIELALRSNAPTEAPPQAKTPPVTIEVKDPLAKEKTPGAMKDIAGPRKPLYFWETRQGRFILTALILAALSAGLWWWHRLKKKQSKDAALARPPLPPEELFEYELRELESSSLLEEGKYREFYFAVSAIFHRYLDGRFSLDTQSLITSELLRLLHNRRDRLDIALGALIVLKETLEIMGLVKFAKYRPSGSEHNKVTATLRDFVAAHKPIVKEPEALSRGADPAAPGGRGTLGAGGADPVAEGEKH